MAVVPVSNEVALHYGRTPVDLVAIVLTVVGLAALLGLGGIDRRRWLVLERRGWDDGRHWDDEELRRLTDDQPFPFDEEPSGEAPSGDPSGGAPSGGQSGEAGYGGRPEVKADLSRPIGQDRAVPGGAATGRAADGAGAYGAGSAAGSNGGLAPRSATGSSEPVDALRSDAPVDSSRRFDEGAEDSAEDPGRDLA